MKIFRFSFIYTEIIDGYLNVTLDFDFTCKQQKKLDKYLDPVIFITTLKKNIENNGEYEVVKIYEDTGRNQWYIDENYNELNILIKESLKESKVFNKIDNFLMNIDKYTEITLDDILEVKRISENIKSIEKVIDDYKIRYYYQIYRKEIGDIYIDVKSGYDRGSVYLGRVLKKDDYKKLTEQLFKNTSGRLKALL